MEQFLTVLAILSHTVCIAGFLAVRHALLLSGATKFIMVCYFILVVGLVFLIFYYSHRKSRSKVQEDDLSQSLRQQLEKCRKENVKKEEIFEDRERTYEDEIRDLKYKLKAAELKREAAEIQERKIKKRTKEDYKT